MRYLFERLGESGAASSEPFDAVAAVQAQLRRIVVGHPGTVGGEEPHLLNFGLPGVMDMQPASTDQAAWLAARIERLINHYEPRLTDVQVAVEPSGELLSPFRVVVQARLKGDKEARVMRFPLEPSLH